MMIRFVIPGEPQGKGRPKFSRQGNFVKTYTPAKTENYEAHIKACFMASGAGMIPQGVEIGMEITAFYSIPKSTSKKRAALTGGGHKKVILLFAGTAWLWSCRFLFQQFFHGDKAHKVVGDADALSALSAALVGGFDVDTLDKLSQGVGCHFLQVLVFVYPLNELL